MKRLLILLAILGITANANAATPTISTVTGTVSTGQTLTISGSNMVQEDNTNWNSFFKTNPNASGFEGSSPASDGYLYGGGSYDTNYKVMGAKSVKYRVTGVNNLAANGGACGGAANLAAYNYFNIPPSGGLSDMYWRAYVMYYSANNKWPNSAVKLFLDQTNSDSTYVEFAGPSGGGDNGYPNEIKQRLFSNNAWHYAGIPTMLPYRWYLVEVRAKRSGTPHISVWVNNVLVQDEDRPTDGSAIDNYLYFNFGIVNACGTLGTNYDLSNWIDGLVVSSSRVYAASLVEISNNATYGSGTVKYQEPVYLSDGSVQIKADLTGLGSGPYYLWVTNNRKERSPAYNLTSGGGGYDTTPPTISLSVPATGEISGTVTITANATDNVAVAGVQLLKNGTNLGQEMTTSPFTYSWNTTTAQNGTYTLTAVARDAAGNTTTSSPVSVTVNNTSSTPSSILFKESFEDSNFAQRGWYDNTNHGTIISGGQTGNGLQWTWAQGGTKPFNGAAMRKLFPATDSLYVSFYTKFQSGWEGSQKAYHPHLITIPSDLDSIYAPLANNYLDTYIEFIADVGSPYAIRPQLGIQDSLRVNTSLGTPPNNLTATTENRSVAYCNSPEISGALGTCYNSGGWYSANTWLASSASVSTNAWHHVEVYFKMNTISGGKGQANGIMTKWIDGVKVIDHSNIVYRTNQDATKKWAQFVLSPYIGDGSPIAQTMWIDELSVATAIPTGSSIAAPAAPTNLTIK